MQVLNVALGGTLVQDLALVPAWREHPSDPEWVCWKRVERASLSEEPLPPHPRHRILIEPGSRLQLALGVTEAEVDSFHHQALDRVAPDLSVVAWAPDGVVEAVEMEDPYVIAVQWELQEEWRADPRFLQVFEQFVGAASGAASLR
jgi:putative glutamine amidotransferase